MTDPGSDPDTTDGAAPDDPGGALGGLDLGGLLGGLGGGGGFGDLLAGAQSAMAASQAAASAEVEGSAGGGVVRIRATGGGDVRSVTIDPAVVDPTDVAGLEDLVLAALRDLNANVSRLHEQAVSGAMGGVDPAQLLGGLGGGIGALLGGGSDDEWDEDDDDWDEDDDAAAEE